MHIRNSKSVCDNVSRFAWTRALYDAKHRAHTALIDPRSVQRWVMCDERKKTKTTYQHQHIDMHKHARILHLHEHVKVKKKLFGVPISKCVKRNCQRHHENYEIREKNNYGQSSSLGIWYTLCACVSVRAKEFRSECTLLRHTIARRYRWTCEIAIDRWFFVSEHTKISVHTLEQIHSTHSPYNTLTWLCFVVLFSILCFSLSKLQNYNYILYRRIFIVTEEIFSFFRFFFQRIVSAKFLRRISLSLLWTGNEINAIELRLSKVINSSVRESVCACSKS